MDKDLVCKACHNPVSPTYFFCPYCGRKLRRPPLSTSAGRQIGIYFLAIFFPLLSIVPGIRYIRQPDNKSKAIGTVTLLLTGISLLLNAYLVIITVEYFKQLLNNPLLIDTGMMESLKGLQ